MEFEKSTLPLACFFLEAKVVFILSSSYSLDTDLEQAGNLFQRSAVETRAYPIIMPHDAQNLLQKRPLLMPEEPNYQTIGRTNLSQNTQRQTSCGTLYPENIAGDCI